MGITASDIHNQSFSVDRKGYDVDEVDVFLEHVAEEIDALNAQIAQLEEQVDSDRFDGFDRPAAEAQPVDDGALAEKDERIAELERQLADRKADDNAIAQALIVAQRSADGILANANATAAKTIQDAEDEAQLILEEAQDEKQKVLDEIKALEDDREDTRDGYKDLLTEFIGDATRKLDEINKAAPKPAVPVSAHAKAPAAADDPKPAVSVQAPVHAEGTASFTAPQPSGAVAVAATPKPQAAEKDFSGFGDVDVEFDDDDLD